MSCHEVQQQVLYIAQRACEPLDQLTASRRGPSAQRHYNIATGKQRTRGHQLTSEWCIAGATLEPRWSHAGALSTGGACIYHASSGGRSPRSCMLSTSPRIKGHVSRTCMRERRGAFVRVWCALYVCVCVCVCVCLCVCRRQTFE